MSRVCEITGKRVMYGNNVSRAMNKTRRRFDINLIKILNKYLLKNINVSFTFLNIVNQKNLQICQLQWHQF